MSLRSPQIKNQMYVFPELLKNKVEKGPHSARFFLFLAEFLKFKFYKRDPMGTVPYNRTVLAGVILYSMYKGHFGANDILKYCHDSIGVHWMLNGMKLPSYKTIERVIQELLDELDSMYIQILAICSALSLIGKKRMYIDGVKIKANASKHKAMSYGHMSKKIEKSKNELESLFESVKENIEELDDSISDDELRKYIEQESIKIHEFLLKTHQDYLKKREEQTFNLDVETADNACKIDHEILRSLSEILGNTCPDTYQDMMDKLNDIAFVTKRVSKMESSKKDLEDNWKRENGDKKIPKKKQINFTDPESCIMVTKHHGVQQCYNNFALVDDKANIILGTYTNSNSSDQLGLIPTIDNTEKLYGSLEGYQMGTDSGFFSSENILYAAGKHIDFYASFPVAKSLYAKDKFKYDHDSNTYTCPAGKILGLQTMQKDGKVCKYSNEEACAACKNQKECTKAKDGARRIERDMMNDDIREKAKAKAVTVEGKEILRLRKTIPEPVWGNMRIQDGLIQMHYRGVEKASLEFKLHAIIHNIRKILKVYFKSSSFQDAIHSKEQGYPQTA
jgi:transposase